MFNVIQRTRRGGLVALVVMAMVSTLLAPLASAEPPGGPVGPAGVAAAEAGRFVGVTPTRALDTRKESCIASWTERSVSIAGKYGVPLGASAIVLNVTVPSMPFGGYVMVYGGGKKPGVSNLNFEPGKQIANAVTTTLAADGSVAVYAVGGGCTQVIVDVVGYYTGGDEVIEGGLTTVPRERLIDTRKDAGSVCAPGGLVLEIDEADADSVVLNVTVVGATAGGHLTVYPTGVRKPIASSLNYVAGQNIANQVTVKLGGGNKISLEASAGCPDVIVDIAGFYKAGEAAVGGFVGITPTRFLDTRTDGSWVCATANSPSQSTLLLAGVNGIPETATGVVLNVTVVRPRTQGYLTVWPSGGSRPGTSSLNYGVNQTIPNQVVTGLGNDGAIAMFALSGCPEVIVDVAGYFVGEASVAPVVIDTSSVSVSATVGGDYSSTPSASGGDDTTYVWSVDPAGDDLPGWLSLDPNTGELSGTPGSEDVGTVTFGLIASSSGVQSAPATVSITVVDGVAVISNTFHVTAGDNPDIDLDASGGDDSSYRWAIAHGSELPEGWTLSEGGKLAATDIDASEDGSFSFDVTVTDGQSRTATGTIDIVVNLKITTTANDLATGVDPFNWQLIARGVAYDGPSDPTIYSWALATGETLPIDWGLAVDGILSGFFTSPGSRTISVVVTDQYGNTSAPTEVTVSAYDPVIVGEPRSFNAAEGKPFSTVLGASGGNGTYSWSLASGSSLPSGWTLDTVTGEVSGTPASGEVLDDIVFSVVASDSNGAASDAAEITIVVHPAVTVTSSSFNTTVNRPLNETLAATGGTVADGYKWALADGEPALPGWLHLNLDGTLSGTPTAEDAGLLTFKVIATDDNNLVSDPATITIMVHPAVSVSGQTFQATVGQEFSETINWSGGNGTYVFTGGDGLPAGLSFSNGAISGTPDAEETQTVTVTVTDTYGSSDTAEITVVVKDPVTVNSVEHSYMFSELPVGGTFNWAPGASGGDATYTWSVAPETSLPTNWSLSEDGWIFGRFTETGSKTITAVVTDGAGRSSGPVEITIHAYSDVEITTTGVDVTAGQAFSRQLTAVGSDGCYEWSAAEFEPAEPMEPSWSLSEAGELTGTLTDSGTIELEVTVIDCASAEASPAPSSRTDTAVVTITIHPAPSIDTTDLHVLAGEPFAETLDASDGYGDLEWSLVNEEDPNGWELSPAGVLSGSAPEQLGDVTVEVKVTDANGASVTKTITVKVEAPVEVETESVSVTDGKPFTRQLAATGGTGDDFKWSVVGTLPYDWTLSSTGELEGETTDGAETVTITVSVTDRDGDGFSSGSTTVTVAVHPAITVTDVSTTATVGDTLDITLTATGGDVGEGDYGWALSGAPEGSDWAIVDGVLVGEVTDADSVELTVTATDANGATGSGTVTISFALVITSTEFNELVGDEGHQFSHNLVAQGGHGQYTWSVISGLPLTMALSGSGTLSGWMSEVTSVNLVVKVTDGDGHSSAETPITVNVYDEWEITSADTFTTHVDAEGDDLVFDLAASGGNGDAEWTIEPVDPENLPAWLTLDGDQLVVDPHPFKIPFGATFPLVATVNVTVTDEATGLSSDDMEIEVTLFDVVRVQPGGFDFLIGDPLYCVVGNACAADLAATGGTEKYPTWTITVSGDGSEHVTLDPASGSEDEDEATRTLSFDTGDGGLEPGTYTVTVEVEDSDGFSDSQSFTIALADAITLVDGTDEWTIGVTTSVQLAGTGGQSGPYTFEIVGANPAALWEIDAQTGEITYNGNQGQLEPDSDYTVDVVVTDGKGFESDTLEFTIATILIPVELEAESTGLEAGTLYCAEDGFCQVVLTASGGNGNFDEGWTVETEGTGGYTLDVTGDNDETGTLTLTGLKDGQALTVTVTVEDTNGFSSAPMDITVSVAEEIGVEEASIGWFVDEDDSATLKATGGSGTGYDFAADTGETDWEVDDEGVITWGGDGAPTTGAVTVTITDSNGAMSGPIMIVVTVFERPVAAIADGYATLECAEGGPCETELEATGGNDAEYTWDISVKDSEDDDVMPSPVSLGEQDFGTQPVSFIGLLTGTYTVTATVTDGDGIESDELTLTINVAQAIGVEEDSVEWFVGEDDSAALEATGGSGFGYDFAADTGETDWEVDDEGVITWGNTEDDPTVGPHTVVVTITDSNGAISAPITITITVMEPVSAQFAAAGNVHDGTLYCVENGPCEISFEATGGTGDYSDPGGWTAELDEGDVSDGFSFGDESQGEGTLSLSGLEQTVSPSTLTVTVTDSSGHSYELTINVYVGSEIDLDVGPHDWAAGDTDEIQLHAEGGGAGPLTYFLSEDHTSSELFTLSQSGLIEPAGNMGGKSDGMRTLYVWVMDGNGARSQTFQVKINFFNI